MSNNKYVNQFVQQATELCKPQNVVWIDGSEKQLTILREIACNSGEIIKLNQQKLPDCYLHRSALNDVARVEERTFICTQKKSEVGITNNWMHTDEAYSMLKGIFNGCMSDRTMYVIPYIMGSVESNFSKVGIEVTDSIYVVLNMAIMTVAGNAALKKLGDSSDFVKGLHSKAQLDDTKRYICHFPDDNAIWSVNSGYGGNALLGKKCFALRIASKQARREGWLAEHMLILGIEHPDGHKNYIAAAFPSACGKTNLAMLIPPKHLIEKGYKVWCVGDDIAWLHKGDDGALYAINPENGFFGVAPGTTMSSNPNAYLATRKGSIFTNVVHNLDDNTVWWEGMDNPPTNALNWKGEKWTVDSGTAGAHPNSRFTTPKRNCPCFSDADIPNGVKIDALVFGGRRNDTVPLVFQARDFEHGVFVASTMTSQTTAAAAGQVGVVRRDPFAMLPFCGYNMADYFQHWLDIGKKLTKAPKIFNVNWFRRDENNKFIWSGFGDNMRVLLWMLDRCNNKVDAEKTAIGYVPYSKDIDTTNLNISNDNLNEILRVDNNKWHTEALAIQEFYSKFNGEISSELMEQLKTLLNNTSK